MAQQADTKIISESVLGTDLTVEECEVLSDIVKHKSLSAEEVLFEPGTKDGNLYILVDGKLDIFKDTGSAASKSLHVATVKKGALIGEASFIDGDAHSMRLQARNASEVIFLSKDDFEATLGNHPKVVYNVMRSIIRYSHKLQRKLVQENVELQRMVQNEYM